MGRLTRDPEMRQTPNGVSVCSFSIAVNRRFAKDGQQNADFINCTAWRQQAEFICKYFQKGAMIAVVGSLQSRSWENQEGKRQYSTDVVVDEVYFTGSKSDSQGSSEGYYVLANFKADGDFPKELDRKFRITDGILRTIIIRKED